MLPLNARAGAPQDRYQIRKAFCAAPGNKLVIADYGQLELRVLAHMVSSAARFDGRDSP